MGPLRFATAMALTVEICMRVTIEYCVV
jgi:hypothetical protein